MGTEDTVDPMLPEAGAVPKFASEEEEREWWASHDTSKLTGKDVVLRPARVKAEVARVVAVPTDQVSIDRLKHLAAERGLDYHELLRIWLDERLQRETSSARSA